MFGMSQKELIISWKLKLIKLATKHLSNLQRRNDNILVLHHITIDVYILYSILHII